MGEYMQRELRLSADEAQALRRRYWQRYGATLLGLVRHHGVKAAHFLHDTHCLPGLEARVSGHRHDLAAIRRLRGRKLILTNAPRAYAMRVLGALRIGHLFDAVISIEDMWMFGNLRPKPDARMFRALCARLRVHRAAVCWWRTRWCIEGRRAVGMGTVWMQRYARAATAAFRNCSRRSHALRPPHVDRVVHRLRTLVHAQGSSGAAIGRRRGRAISGGRTAGLRAVHRPARCQRRRPG